MTVAIKPLRKFTTGTPTTSDMVEGELAVNTADQKIFMRDGSNNIVEVGAAKPAADDIVAGDAAVNITTSTGNITIDAQGDNTDIIFKGTDDTADITMLTLDGSEAGLATFNSSIKIADNGFIGTATTPGLIKLESDNVRISNTGTSDTNAMLQLYSEDTGSGSAPDMYFWRNSSSPAASDFLGKIIFYGENDADEGLDYASIATQITSVADGVEAARFVFYSRQGGASFNWQIGSNGVDKALTIPDGTFIGSTSDRDAISIGSDGDVTLTQDLELQHDGAILSFGANDEIALTHVHDTGLALTDSGGTPTLQLHDSNEAVSSDGTNLMLTSGGVTFKIPTADGSADHVLKTDGGGNLSFVAQSGGSSVTIGENAPGGPSAGDMWWDSSDDQGRLKVYYNDGNSSQWVDAFPSIAPVEDRVILNGTDGVSANAGDELLGEDNSFVQLEPATTDFFDNPVIPSIQFTNTTNAFVTTLSAASSADASVDVSTLQTEDDVIGLIMAMG